MKLQHNGREIVAREGGQWRSVERLIRHRGVELRVLDSCTYRFLLDVAGRRYARVPQGISVGVGGAVFDWHPYHEVEVDMVGGTFTVVLNQERSRLITAELHGEKCSCLTTSASTA